MPKRIALTQLNARTIDILNVIRQNASYEYQSQVPVIEKESDIPAVGEILYGNPALSNTFINALVNRIAVVRVKSATFNNDLAELKKGYLEFGETVEEVFVEMAKAREFNVEKAEAREFKRTLTDVRSAFHCINWKVQYPVTIQNEDLRMAFLSAEGVTDLITKIVDQVYTAAEYDEYLLFKYLLIKAVNQGKAYPIGVDASNPKDCAVKFRGTSNLLPFISTKYNISGVHTNTKKEDQYIFMDAEYNAEYDVEVLASAFNMDRATFMGKLKLVDSWSTFDNERFSEIVANTSYIEEVTEAELGVMANVKAILVDKEWFQVYDNLAQFTEKYVANGMYWNYFYNTWKTVSSSPFSNMVVFMDSNAVSGTPATITATVQSVVSAGDATIVTLTTPDGVSLVETGDAVEAGVAVHKYGAVILPKTTDTYTVEATLRDAIYDSEADAVTAELAVGDTITLTKRA